MYNGNNSVAKPACFMPLAKGLRVSSYTGRVNGRDLLYGALARGSYYF